MAGQFHGWKEANGEWVYADINGFQEVPNVFVINNFGTTKSCRDVLSAVVAAMAQFPGRVHLRRTEQTDRMMDELIEASLLRMAPIRGGEHEEFGVLGVRRATPPKAPWWKFWSA